MPSFTEQTGCTAGLVTAGDLIRGLGVLTGIEAVEVPGATGWFDTDYEGKRDAALATLEAGADLFLVHIEATDEAGHAGNLEEKIKALEAWDTRVLPGLVDGLDAMGQWQTGRASCRGRVCQSVLISGVPDTLKKKKKHKKH